MRDGGSGLRLGNGKTQSVCIFVKGVRCCLKMLLEDAACRWRLKIEIGIDKAKRGSAVKTGSVCMYAAVFDRTLLISAVSNQAEQSTLYKAN